MSSERTRDHVGKLRRFQCDDGQWIRLGAGVALGGTLGIALGLLSGDLYAWLGVGFAIGGGISTELSEQEDAYVWLGIDWMRFGAGITVGLVLATVAGAFLGSDLTLLAAGYLLGGVIGLLLQWWRPDSGARV